MSVYNFISVLSTNSFFRIMKPRQVLVENKESEVKEKPATAQEKMAFMDERLKNLARTCNEIDARLQVAEVKLKSVQKRK